LLIRALTDPSLADQALPIFETDPTLCDCAAFVHTIAVPIAAFLNIYSRLLVEWRKTGAPHSQHAMPDRH
jgi:hypothetical protein